MVLSNALLVKQSVSTALDSFQSIIDYVMREDVRDFTLPYRLLNISKLRRANALDENSLAELATGKNLLLHYFPNTLAARQRVDILEEYTDILGRDAPVFFVQRKKEGRKTFSVINFLEIDVNQFSADQLNNVAFKSVTLSKNSRSDAKDLVISRFKRNIDEMRRDNLRYILLGRAFGQGFDIFNVTEVFNTEPAPDRTTEIQRRGRFARPGSHASLPYDRWQVTYYTFAAKLKTANTQLTEEDIAPYLGEGVTITPELYQLLANVELDPLTTTSPVPNPLVIHPYMAVRIRVAEAEADGILTSLERLKAEATFDSWAIDKTLNTIQRDSDATPIYADTNYTINSKFLISHYKKQIRELPVPSVSKSEYEEKKRDIFLQMIAEKRDLIPSLF
jgi:superfamily II DNA/RNA helicase